MDPMWWTIIHAKHFRDIAMRFVGGKTPKKSVRQKRAFAKKTTQEYFSTCLLLIYVISRKKAINCEYITYIILYIMAP